MAPNTYLWLVKTMQKKFSAIVPLGSQWEEPTDLADRFWLVQGSLVGKVLWRTEALCRWRAKSGCGLLEEAE